MNTLDSLHPMVFSDGHGIIVQGPVTIDHVVTLTKNGIALFNQQHCVIDLKKVTEVDSTIISMLLEWLRVARQGGYQLKFINMPESLESLIKLYGIAELIPVARDHVAYQQGTV